MRSSMVRSSSLHGAAAVPVGVEVNISNGLPYYSVVGLGDSAVRESAQRVKAACKNSGFRWPDQRITINLSPAWLSKKGSTFDLPIALGILQATGQLPEHLQLAAWGELSLTGKLKSAPGALCLADGLINEDPSQIMIHPAESEPEIKRHWEGGLYAEDLRSLVSLLKNGFTENSCLHEDLRLIPHVETIPEEMLLPIYLQQSAWRACLLAVAGAHHLLMLGAPGCGKTTLARAAHYLLPDLSREEQYQLALQYSAAKVAVPEQPDARAGFRAPHFSVSAQALLGGGTKYSLGEVSLADQGILFLDEISEFTAAKINQLRQPIEDHQVKLHQSGQVVTLPARFILIAAANGCKCGQFFEKEQVCTCSDGQIKQYRDKFRNPFYDRIDLYVEMLRLPSEELNRTLDPLEVNPLKYREQVRLARERQFERQGKGSKDLLRLNGWLPTSEINESFGISRKVLQTAETLADQLKLSIRSYQKLLRVSRTLADLADVTEVTTDHVIEAFSYKNRLAAGERKNDRRTKLLH